MARLWGREYTRAELLQFVGRLDQVGGVEPMVLDDGPERGVHALRFTTPSGLSCTVLPDRGMDISDLSWRGQSLCWHGTTGRVSPTLFQLEELGFLRSFFGGMLTTCGLTNFGPGGQDGGERLYPQGLASNLPASNVTWGERWDGDNCTLFARGSTRETRLLGPNLTLTRSIEVDLEGMSLRLDDVVRNEAWEETPHMILYHINTGFPLLNAGASLEGRFESVMPHNAEAEKGMQTWRTFTGPQAHFKEQVFITQPEPDSAQWNEVVLWNPGLDGGLGLRLRWDATTLPWMPVWRQLGQGAYIVAMEPTNCPTLTGRDQARAAGTLRMLGPGEERRYRLDLSVVTSLRSSG